MRTISIKVRINDGIKISDEQVIKNIQFVLDQHFKSMQSYSLVPPPRIDKINFEDGEK